MTMAETNPTTLAPSCYLLDKLPVELRLSIYEFTFEGSRVRATLAENAKSSSAQRTAVILKHSKHFSLLLSCRTIYYEALATYWSKTVLRLNCPPLIFGSIHAFRPAKLKLDTYAYRLVTSLPEAAKAHVRHVRGMVLPALKSAWVEENPSMTAPALLGTFKQLATCDMTPTLAHTVDGLVVHYEDLKDKNYSRFNTAWGMQPVDLLAERWGVDNTAEVAFFFKGFTKCSQRWDDNGLMVFENSKRRRPQFRNFSTGIAFEDVTGKMDDEEGYKKVLQANV